MLHRRPFHRRRTRLNRVLPQPAAIPPPAVPRAPDGPVPMQALTLIYHEDFEPQITGIIQRKMLVARYTRVRDVVGARADIMQDMDITPEGKNHMLIIVATQQVIDEIAAAFRALREMKGHGLRGYITPVDGLI